MKTSRPEIVVAAVLIALITPPSAASAQQIGFSSGPWKLTGDSTRVETFDGRESLRLETGEASRPDIVFRDGTIDVDVMVSARRSFVYLAFRQQESGDREEFYLRPHKSTLPDAVQYAPVFQGQSAWQLYHGPNGTASPAIEAGVWQHLRIVLAGRRAAFFLGDTTTPILVLPHLARDPVPGFISLAGFVPAGTRAGAPAARFSNLRVQPGVVAYAFDSGRVAPLLPGTIQRWEVGEAFAAPDSAVSTLVPQWLSRLTVVAIEPQGFVELHRHVPMPKVQRYVGAVARVRVLAREAGARRLDLGFSDRVTVFLNGQPIFHRDDSYDYAGRRDGIISLDQATVYLPLRAGANDVSVLVTDRFGGWGIMGRFPDMRGLTLGP
jgi:hypothetical protein